MWVANYQVYVATGIHLCTVKRFILTTHHRNTPWFQLTCKGQHIIIILGSLEILGIRQILSANFWCELFHQNFVSYGSSIMNAWMVNPFTLGCIPMLNIVIAWIIQRFNLKWVSNRVCKFLWSFYRFAILAI